MLRLLGMRCGLYMGMPSPASCIHNDKLMEELNDLLGGSNKYFFNPDLPQSAIDEWMPKVQKIFMGIEAKMKAEGWCHVAGNSPLPADFQVLNYYTTYVNNDTRP